MPKTIPRPWAGIIVLGLAHVNVEPVRFPPPPNGGECGDRAGRLGNRGSWLTVDVRIVSLNLYGS
jgi:hypothetical protein